MFYYYRFKLISRISSFFLTNLFCYKTIIDDEIANIFYHNLSLDGVVSIREVLIYSSTYTSSLQCFGLSIR